METSITSHVSIKGTDQTNEIIARIVNLVMVQQIYCTIKLSPDKPLTELIILISNKCSKTLIEYMPLINMAFEDYPDYCYRLYYVHQAKDSIKKGNLFFHNVCSVENLCYTNPTVEPSLFAEVQSLEKVIDKAKKVFNKEITKIQAFNDGASFYWEKENYALTAFMVHQQIELAYRAIEFFAMGKDKVTHSIRVHQKHVGPYLPVLGALFDESNDFENKLMQHLDDAYLVVRYGDNYQINKDKLLKAMEKGELVQKIVANVYEKMIGDFEQKLLTSKADHVVPAEQKETPEEPNKEFILNDNDVDLVRVLTTDSTVERAYYIHRESTSSKRDGVFQKDAVKESSRHFLLLLITEEPCNMDSFKVSHIMNQIHDISATVTLLVHSTKNVNEALLDNNLFFHEVLRSDYMIYQNKALPRLIELPEYDSSKALSSVNYIWQRRKQRAESLLEASAAAAEYEPEVVEISLLNQAMEQLCLGFIFASTGYKPNQQSLKHLANICRCITPEFDEAIPTGTEDDQRVFNLLVDSIKNTRYRVPYSIDPVDVGLLHRRCSVWMKKAEELVSKKLKMFES